MVVSSIDDLFGLFYDISFPEENRDRNLLHNGKRALVHYTSAETGAKIIKSKKLWLRNARNTNDKSEIIYSLSKFEISFKKYSDSYEKLFYEIDRVSGPQKFANFARGYFLNIIDQSFISCFSNHPAGDLKLQDFGKLSMWRAYGSANAVCIVLNAKNIFDTNIELLRAPLIKIRYDGEYFFNNELERFLFELNKNISLLKSDPELAFDLIAYKMQIDVLSVKHPSFKEEEEYRIVFSPSAPSEIVKNPHVETINGLPELFYSVPLDLVGNDESCDLRIEKVIKKIVIGPSNAQEQLRASFEHLLRESGVSNAETRVQIADVPLRV